MITVEQKEQIRRWYYLEEKSIRQIARETGWQRSTIRKVLDDDFAPEYQRAESSAALVLGPVKAGLRSPSTII